MADDMMTMMMTTPWTSNGPLSSSSFVYTVMENLGLCVHVTDHLDTVLQVNAVIQTVVSLLGIIGAILSLCVCCTKRKRCSLKIQVALLSLYDLLFLTMVLLIAILRLSRTDNDAASKTLHVLQQLFLWGVNYTMVDICIERCVSIDKPFLARKVFSVGFTRKRAAAVLVVGLAFTVPFLLDSIFGYSRALECLSEDRSLTLFGVVYTLYLVIIFLYLLPFVVILVVNVKLVVALYRFGQHRPLTAPSVPATTATANANATVTTQADDTARQLSRFVVGVNMWYVTCMLFPSVFFLVRLTRIELFDPETDVVTAVAADTLIAFSVSANFFFYFLMWRNFRQTFFLLFCKRCRLVDLEHSSTDPNSSSHHRHTTDSSLATAGEKLNHSSQVTTVAVSSISHPVST